MRISFSLSISYWVSKRYTWWFKNTSTYTSLAIWESGQMIWKAGLLTVPNGRSRRMGWIHVAQKSLTAIGVWPRLTRHITKTIVPLDLFDSIKMWCDVKSKPKMLLECKPTVSQSKKLTRNLIAIFWNSSFLVCNGKVNGVSTTKKRRTDIAKWFVGCFCRKSAQSIKNRLVHFQWTVFTIQRSLIFMTTIYHHLCSRRRSPRRRVLGRRRNTLVRSSAFPPKIVPSNLFDGCWYWCYWPHCCCYHIHNFFGCCSGCFDGWCWAVGQPAGLYSRASTERIARWRPEW